MAGTKIVDITSLGRFFDNIKTYVSGLLLNKQDAIATLDDNQKTLIRENLGLPSNDYIVSVFEELKQLIENNNTTDAIAVLDKAILDMHKLQ